MPPSEPEDGHATAGIYWCSGERGFRLILIEPIWRKARNTMAINVSDWLHSLGLEQYAEAFRDNDLDGGVLSEVNADVLIAIGIPSIGHRRKLLAAIAALKSEVAPTVDTGATADP